MKPPLLTDMNGLMHDASGRSSEQLSVATKITTEELSSLISQRRVRRCVIWGVRKRVSDEEEGVVSKYRT